MSRLLLLFLAWIAGVVAYMAALRGLHGEVISAGDLYPVLIWSFLAWCAVSPCALLPMFRWLQHLGGRYTHPASLAIVGLAASALPAALVLGVWGGLSLEGMFSPEAVLFYAMFGVSGVILGLGYARLQQRAA